MLKISNVVLLDSIWLVEVVELFRGAGLQRAEEAVAMLLQSNRDDSTALLSAERDDIDRS